MEDFMCLLLSAPAVEVSNIVCALYVCTVICQTVLMLHSAGVSADLTWNSVTSTYMITIL